MTDVVETVPSAALTGDAVGDTRSKPFSVHITPIAAELTSTPPRQRKAASTLPTRALPASVEAACAAAKVAEEVMMAYFPPVGGNRA